jgi:glycine/D-amino acid oxidase-like deaminating enzyme
VKHVIVIGSGIIGASIAFHLASAGAQVTLLESEARTGGLATPASWAWINASWGNDQEYVALRMRAMNGWRSLDKRVPGLVINWCGSLLWDLPHEKLLAFAAEHKSWGYRTRIVSRAEAEKIEPALRDPPDTAVHVASEGSVEPAHAAEKLLDAARGAGARIIAGAHAKYLNEQGGRIVGVTTSEETLDADEVVVAAGIQSAGLLQSVGMKLSLQQPAGLLVHSAPMPEVLHGLVLAPKLHVRQTSEGRLIAGSDFAGGDPSDNPEAAAAALFKDVDTLLSTGPQFALEEFTIGRRPALLDGIPALGRPRAMPGLYLAVTHSGITLAPAVGEIATDELLHNRRDPALARYLPDRVIA